jgi:hypothetical protein
VDKKAHDNMNDKALDIMADIFEPMCELMKDKEYATLYFSDYTKAVAYACKHHKKEMIEIAAAIEGVPADEYIVNPFALPIKLVATMGAYNKITRDLFTSQGQNMEETSSGSATENTEAVVQPIDS